jgi:leucyl aminopeptidase
MQMELFTQRPAAVAGDCVIAGIYDDRMLTSACAELDDLCQGAIKKLIDTGDISGKLGASRLLFQLPGIGARVLIVGLGEQRKFDASRFVRVQKDAHKALQGLPINKVASYLTEVDVPGRDLGWRIKMAALAFGYGAYRYTATIKSNGNGKSALQTAAFSAPGYQGSALEQAIAIDAGIALARELGNLPPNICTPAYLVEQARNLSARQPSIRCEILDRAQMETLGMGSLLAVGRGSANPPYLVVMHYQGGASDAAPHVFVGKGITFDTGGISLKPGAGMEEMKFDMCGAASVYGLMEAIARLQLPLNIVGIAACVENMPGGDAYRPSDVVKTMAGHTVEVLNTDAEGRLILCDALTYAERFKARTLIDIATLTGACVVALGSHASGLMSKDDDLAAELMSAGETSMDRAWRLPLWEDYQSQLETGFADFANIGGKNAGAITAGCFLSRFTEGQRWAHLDIAGSAWESGRKGTATGRPVGLLMEWLLRQTA